MKCHKSLMISIVLVLLSTTMGTCFSVTDQTGASSILTKNEMHLLIGYSGPQIEWSKTFGGVRDEIAYSVCQISDGGYILTGMTQSYGNGAEDIWLIRTDSDGNELWNRTFGGPGMDFGTVVIEALDGGFIIGGNTESFGSGLVDFWVLKVDENGEMIWNRLFGGSEDDFLHSIIPTSEGDYILVGDVDMSQNHCDLGLIKTDREGNEIWSRKLGGVEVDWGSCVQQLRNGGFIISGCKTTGNYQLYDIWLIKTDASGTIEWETTFGDEDTNDYGSSVIELNEGGFLVAGGIQDRNSNPRNGWLLRTDDYGNIVWSKKLVGMYFQNHGALKEASDGRYILSGWKTDSDSMDSVLLKIDTEGGIIWDTLFEGEEDEFALECQQTFDDGYIITGYIIQSSSSALADAWLVKLASFENSPPYKPDLQGSTSGKVGDDYVYTAATEDPEKDDVYYLFEWGDGTNSNWLGPYRSGEECNASHTWTSRGNYEINVKAKDTNSAESVWSDPLPITMPYSYKPMLWFLDLLFQRFPHAFPLLRQLMEY